MRLPNTWGLGQAEIHSSLFATLALLGCLFLGLSCFNQPSFSDLRSVAITLPVVWLVSLAFRIAAQQLAIGEFAHESQTVVGPSGNLHTDYEYLAPRHMLCYSITGQLASVGLIALGLVINAALAESPASTAELLDLKGGWGSRAWATQIMWVNIFLFCLHLLPTVPFDMRASVFAMFSMKSRTAQEPLVFRRMAAFNSHLSAMMFGVGASAACLGALLGREILGWYAAIAAAVYLFVASQWENARAEELEQEYVPMPTRLTRHDNKQDLQPHLNFEGNDAETAGADDEFIDHGEARQAAEEFLGGYEGDLSAETPPDVDEILRKLHREGPDSLTVEEHQALLSASREIQERRGPAT